MAKKGKPELFPTERIFLGDALLHLCEVFEYFDTDTGNGRCADVGALPPEKRELFLKLCEEAITRLEIILDGVNE